MEQAKGAIMARATCPRASPYVTTGTARQRAKARTARWHRCASNGTARATRQQTVLSHQKNDGGKPDVGGTPKAEEDPEVTDEEMPDLTHDSDDSDEDTAPSGVYAKSSSSTPAVEDGAISGACMSGLPRSHHPSSSSTPVVDNGDFSGACVTGPPRSHPLSSTPLGQLRPPRPLRAISTDSITKKATFDMEPTVHS